MAGKITGIQNQIHTLIKPILNSTKPVVAQLNPNDNVFANNHRDRFLGGDLLKTRLNSFFDRQMTPVKAETIDPKRVEDAVSKIKDRLSQGFTDWDVSHGDLKDIQNTFKGLNKEEANAVFAKLSKSDLDNWTDELNGINGGYSDSEKKNLFGELAGKLDARNLARLNEALDEKGDRMALADAVAQNAPDDVKLNYVKELAAKAGTDEKSAVALAQLLGGLKGDVLQKAIESLSDSQLSAVTKAATQEEIHTHSSPFGGGGSVSVSHDPKPLARFLEAASSISDPNVKARVFEAGANELKRIDESGGLFAPSIGKKEDSALVRNALTKLIDSDTTGIVEKLEKENNGDALKSYIRSMLATGEKADQDKIGQQISKLLSGNNINQNPVSRFEEQAHGTTGRAYNQNARTLGFYAGSIHAAVNSITDERGKQASMFKNIFETAAGIVGAKFPVAGALANGINNAIVDEVVSNLDNKDYSLRNALFELTIPHDANGDLYTGPARDSYDAAFAATAARNDN